MCKNQRDVEWRKQHPRYSSEYSKAYGMEPKHRTRRNERQRQRWANDKRYRIEMLLRRRLRRAMKGVWSRESMTLLGCSLEELLQHLESQFKEGMTWNNWGKWHIDHIIPLSSFDLFELEGRKKACHFTNLQPLWAKDNVTKGNKILVA